MKQDLLLLVHRLPYPPNKGDKIRSWNLFKYLKQHFNIYLGCFIDDPDDWQYTATVKSHCQETHILELNSKLATLGSFRGFLKNTPLTLPYYHKRSMRTWVNKTLHENQIQHIVVFSSSMAQYVEQLEKPANRIIDFVDIDSDKWQQYSNKCGFPMRQVYSREAKKLRLYENRVSALFDQSLFVSSQEADLFREMNPSVTEKVDYFNNGVDIDFFKPDHNYPNPYPDGVQVLVFSGAMDYWANVDAVTWFAEHIWPDLNEHNKNIKFYIVGRNPTPQVLKLNHTMGIEVTGTVEDIRPYLSHANICVAPLRIARGIQNKVLEAMALEKPILVSAQGYEGIETSPELCCQILNQPDEWVKAIEEWLKNPPEASFNRSFILKNYHWNNSLLRLNPHLQLPVP